jgi:hypothetical protein
LPCQPVPHDLAILHACAEDLTLVGSKGAQFVVYWGTHRPFSNPQLSGHCAEIVVSNTTWGLNRYLYKTRRIATVTNDTITVFNSNILSLLQGKEWLVMLSQHF